MIDELYGCTCGCCNGGVSDSAVSVGVEISDDLLDEILQEIYNEEVDEQSGISPTLFQANRDYFHKAIDDGIINSANADIDDEQDWIDALKHSADVFSLHRTANQCALLVESMVDSDGNLKSFEQFKKDTQSINNHYNKAWLRTEYDTAVLRAQMGADWKMFQRDADVLPNLKWMPTTSANPREEHAVFWKQGLTLPIDDKFWNKHRPGDQWNCKCWLEQTDAEPTAPEDMPDSADMPEPKAGLRGNPAKTKEIFSQDHPHFPNKCATCHLNTDGKVHGVKGEKKVDNSKGKKMGRCILCNVASTQIDKLEKKKQDKVENMYSFDIKNELSKLKNNQERNSLLEAFFYGDSAKLLKETDNARTVVYPKHKGLKKDSWEATQKMAFEMNKKGRSVAFLNEHDRKKSADAVSFVNGRLQICDFKYSEGCSWNTLQTAFVEGFEQADAIIFKGDIDAGIFKEAIGYIKRNYPKSVFGDMLIINKHGKLLDLSKDDFIKNKYMQKIKGFL